MTTSTEKAYKFVRQSILQGEFLPGMRLRETAIAATADVSRTPVREALRQLSAEGLVDFEANMGARVASWSREDAEEITAIRVLLEGYAAELAARKITLQQLDELSSVQNEMEAAIDLSGGPDYGRIADSNTRFHSLIISAAGSTRIQGILQQVVQTPLSLRKFAAFDRDRLMQSVFSHREIISALKIGDSELAGAMMRAHLLSARAYDGNMGPVNSPANDQASPKHGSDAG